MLQWDFFGEKTYLLRWTRAESRSSEMEQSDISDERLAMRSPALLDLGERSATSEPHSGSCATLRGTSKMQCGSNVRRTYVFLFFRSGASNFWERV